MNKLQMGCMYWQANPRFVSNKHKPEHVNILKNSVRRNLRIPHDFFCITDTPDGLDDDIRIIPLWNDLAEQGYCMRRLRAFSEEMKEVIGPRFAWLDLDVVIVDDITPIFDTDADFKISGVELREQPYNGSIVLMDAGARAQVYHDFDRDFYERVKAEKNYGGSDQAWYAVCLGEREQTWQKVDGIYNYREHIAPAPPLGTGGGLPKNARIVVFNGRFSPEWKDIQEKSPWIKEHWR